MDAVRLLAVRPAAIREVGGQLRGLLGLSFLRRFALQPAVDWSLIEAMRLGLMKWGFFLSCLLLGTFTGVAQEKAPLGTLSGIVQDPTGAVIAGAQVELKSGDVVLQTTVTD